jgi:hypothetical protein
MGMAIPVRRSGGHPAARVGHPEEDWARLDIVGYVIVAGVVVVLGVFVTREVLRRRETSIVRDEEKTQPARFSTPVKFKRDSAPGWALGAAGFTLIVRSKAFSVVGPGESQSWYFTAAESTVERESSRTPTGATKEWIVIEGTDSGKRIRLRISPTDRRRLWEAWSALVTEGAVALSDPPLPES